MRYLTSFTGSACSPMVKAYILVYASAGFPHPTCKTATYDFLKAITPGFDTVQGLLQECYKSTGLLSTDPLDKLPTLEFIKILMICYRISESGQMMESKVDKMSHMAEQVE